MSPNADHATRTGITRITCFNTDELQALSALARKGVFEICLTANHGHVGGSSAASELFVSLYFGGILRFNPTDPYDPGRDLVLVRGHLGPLRYKLFSWLGWLNESELATYRRIGSRLHGHEDHLETPGVDISPSGSLGMILSYGVGAALGARDTGRDFRTFVFLGDGEEQEGVVSEAARHAAHLRIGNLVAIIDRNGKQLSNPVAEVDTADLAKIWEGYGWTVIRLTDGHNIEMTLSAFTNAVENTSSIGKPTLIIAETVKGIGLEGAAEHYSGYHTMSRIGADAVQAGISHIEASLDQEHVQALLGKMAGIRGNDQVQTRTSPWTPVQINIRTGAKTPNHPDDCQFEYFTQLRKLVEAGVLDANDLYFLTADVTTSEVVKALKLSQIFHFHNVGIREQHMVAMVHGLTVTRPEARVLVNSFDAFTYRCIDQINATLQGQGNLVIIGDVSGITNSRNGKTHQTTGLPAALLSMAGLTFLEPWDASDTFACLNWALGESRGVVYIRVHSSPARHVPSDSCVRTISYYEVTDQDETPDLTIVGAGVAVDSCLDAAEMLKTEGIRARVINVINPNSLDEGFGNLIAEGRPLLTVFNGNPRVLRQAVADALMRYGRFPSTIEGLGFEIGNTGTFLEMLVWAGIDGQSVYERAKRLT